jgi:putative ABC transport system substrate-binding protein
MFRVGYLSPSSASDAQAQQGREIFRQQLRELGYVEGESITIEYRFAEGKYERLPRLAAELVDAKVDVIVTVAGVPPAQAAQRATRVIPIVLSGTVDPVAAGLVATLARPGGNITGPTIISEALLGKQLELLGEVVPKVSRVAVLSNPANPGNARQLRAAAATASRLRLRPVEARDSNEIEQAFAAMTRHRADALIVLADAIFLGERERIVGLAAKHRLPAIYGLRTYSEAGGLMAYAASLPELRRQTAVYVSKILKGAKPADLPVEEPPKFELVINLRAANALGLTIPPSLLLRADQVIE